MLLNFNYRHDLLPGLLSKTIDIATVNEACANYLYRTRKHVCMGKVFREGGYYSIKWQLLQIKISP